MSYVRLAWMFSRRKLVVGRPSLVCQDCRAFLRASLLVLVGPELCLPQVAYGTVHRKASFRFVLRDALRPAFF